MTQFAYRAAPAAAQPGTPYGIADKTVLSGLVQTAAIRPGVCVFRGSVERGVVLPTGAGDVTAAKFQGVTQITESKVDPEYAVNTFAPVQADDFIWAEAETDVAVAARGLVYVRHTANGAGKLVLGAVRADVDGGNATLLPGVEFYTPGADGVAVLWLRPGGTTAGPQGPQGPQG